MIPSHEDVFPEGKIFYQTYYPAQAWSALAATVLVIAVMLWSLFSGSLQVGPWILTVIFLLLALSLVTTIQQIISGPRSITIDGDALKIVYPKEVLQAIGASLTDVSAFRRKSKKKGRLKGVTVFKSQDGKKRTLSFNFSRPGGVEAFVWFERIQHNSHNDIRPL